MSLKIGDVVKVIPSKYVYSGYWNIYGKIIKELEFNNHIKERNFRILLFKKIMELDKMNVIESALIKVKEKPWDKEIL